MDILDNIKTHFSSSETNAQGHITALFEAYKKPVTGSIRTIYPAINQAKAEEIYWETFTELFKNVKKGSLTKLTSSLGTYLIQIAKNKACNYLRDELKYHDMEFTDDFPEIADSDEEDMERLQKFEIVRDTVAAMGFPCKEILTLALWHRKKTKEIAKVINYTEGSTKNRKKACMEELKKSLIEEFIKAGLNFK